MKFYFFWLVLHPQYNLLSIASHPCPQRRKAGSAGQRSWRWRKHKQDTAEKKQSVAGALLRWVCTHLTSSWDRGTEEKASLERGDATCLREQDNSIKCLGSLEMVGTCLENVASPLSPLFGPLALVSSSLRRALLPTPSSFTQYLDAV